MAGLASRLKWARSRKALVVAVVVAVGLGAAVVGYVQTRDGEEAALEEGQQLVEVRLGDLVNQVTSSGSIIFPNREELSFGVAGTVSALLVAEGDAVAAGQPLARLDDETAARLERDAAQAEADLQDSQDALDDAMAPPTTLARVEAEAAVAKAELSLQQAEEALVDLNAPFTQAEIDEARADVSLAEESVVRAQADLALDLREHADTVEAAADTLESAKEDYQGVVRTYLGMAMAPSDYARAPSAFLAHYGLDADDIFSDARTEEAVAWVLPTFFQPAQPLDDPSTPWDEFTVYSWIALYPGTVHGTCENTVVESQDRCMLRDMEEAWDRVDAAQSGLDNAENNAAKAQSNGDKAVDKEEDALTAAREALDDMLASADPLEVAVKTHDVEVARAVLADTRDTLAELDDAPDPVKVALMEAEIKADEVALVAARDALASLVITAPFAGVVSAVNVEQGRSVTANAAILEIVDPTVAEVDARLDEIDVLTVREGAEAMISLDGLPGAQLPGVVTSISRTGDNQQGVVTYPVQISVRTPPFLQLREGLSATASIVLQQELGALLIPTTAIAGTIMQPTVLVSVDGEVTERPVTLGASDGFWTVVTSGVAEGEQIVATSGGPAADIFGNMARFQTIAIQGGAPPGAQGLSQEQRQALREQFRQQGGFGGGQGGQGGQPPQQPQDR